MSVFNLQNKLLKHKDSYLFTFLSNGQEFLIDGGAAASVYPVEKHEISARTTNFNILIGPSGEKIPSYGYKNINFKLNNQLYTWPFILAPVTRALVGSDFLVENDLLCDTRRRCVIPAAEFYSKLQPTPQILTVNTISQSNEVSKEYLDIVNSFPSILSDDFTKETVEHGVELHIETTGPPVKFKSRKLDPIKYRDAKAEFEKLIAKGIVEPSDSNWASCLHMVKKKNGDWRPCGDYRLLNINTKPDSYPIPNLHDFSGQLEGCTVFSTLDIRMGYHNVPIRKEDRHKTALITPFGLYQYKRMPFGLKNSAATFQRLMDRALRNLRFVFDFVDDILIASRNKAEHKEHLRQVLRRLDEYGLCLNLEKCVFGVDKIEFLGHLVTSSGIAPSPKKVEAITNFPRPQTIKQLQEFLGMLNFYRKFLPNIATVLRPLHDFLKSAFETHGLKPNTKTKKLLPTEWPEDALKSFETSKNLLSSATLLNFPVDNWQLSLTTDASDRAYGAALEQFNPIKQCFEPLSFYSKKFTKTETDYSTFDKELTAIFHSIRHFRHYLEGRNFVIWTDHRPILFSLHKKSDPWSARQRRQLLEISEYSADIRHVSGRNNLVSDALSRNPVNHVRVCAISKDLSVENIASHQKGDQELLRYLENKDKTGLILSKVPLPESTESVICDLSEGRQRPYVPETLQREVFDKFHSLNHAGIAATTKLISDRFVWIKMKSKIKEWTRNCVICQTSKIQQHTKSPIIAIEMPTRRFRAINVDLVGPLPESNGYKYLLTIIDRFTRWPEVIPLRDIETTTVAQAFLENYVARFGICEEILSDRGSQFTSKLWDALLKLYGIKRRLSTSYHPQRNGCVERLHRSLKNGLKARCKKPNDWYFELPSVLLGLRTAPKEGLGCSSAELVYGETISIPGEMLKIPATLGEQETVTELRRVVNNFAPKKLVKLKPFVPYIPKDLFTSKFVFVRRDGQKVPIQKPYDGPFEVIEHNQKALKLQIGSSQDWVSVDRIKPAHLDLSEPIKLALPPRKGRPRKDLV